MTIRNAILTSLLAAGMAVAAKSRCGTLHAGQDAAVLQIPHPPDALLRAKNLQIHWDSTGAFPDADPLVLTMKQALSREYGFSDSNPDAVLRLAAVSWEQPWQKTEVQRETRKMKVGETPVYDKNGKQSGTQDILQDRVVPVTYWRGGGSLSIMVTAVDNHGAVIDSFTASGAYHNTIELLVDGQAPAASTPAAVTNPSSGGGWSSLIAKAVRDGLNRSANRAMGGAVAGPVTAPTLPAIEAAVLQQIAASLTRRYTSTSDTVAVTLACDGELRTGNKLARDGQWKEAIKAWQDAKLKKNSADQIFNLAVGTEASAYAEYGRTQDLNDMLPMFNRAMQLYEKALNGDPEEKYMREQRDRLKTAKKDIENVRRQYEVQQGEAIRAQQNATEVMRCRNAASDTSDDTNAEAGFRMIARAQLSGAVDPATDRKRDELIATGERLYGLEKVQSCRVVWQEIARGGNIGQNLKVYDDTCKALSEKDVLTAEHFATLRALQKQTGLDDSEVRAIEAKYPKLARATHKAPERVAAAETPSPGTPAEQKRPPAKHKRSRPASESVPEPTPAIEAPDRNADKKKL
jgi:hypothetical protein